MQDRICRIEENLLQRTAGPYMQRTAGPYIRVMNVIFAVCAACPLIAQLLTFEQTSPFDVNATNGMPLPPSRAIDVPLA